MLPLVKEVSVFGLDNRLGLILLYIVFNMPMNTLFVHRVLKKYSRGFGGGRMYRRRGALEGLLEGGVSHAEAHARHSGDHDGPLHLE